MIAPGYFAFFIYTLYVGVLLAGLVNVGWALWGLPPALPGDATPWSHSLFPWSLLIAIPALAVALRTDNPNLAAATGPSPPLHHLSRLSAGVFRPEAVAGAGRAVDHQSGDAVHSV